MSQPGSNQPSTSTTWTNIRAMLRALMDLLLDFSFKRFVTPHLIRLLYALSLGAALLAALTWMFSGGGDQGWLYGMFKFITGPLAFLLYMISARVIMEVVLAIIEIAEKVRKM
ncbi:DUF4282 domain-containing protein [Brevifollis gellanilyticus]|uniref:DUF4282 domain-containing protein n=1 Tax=Brevifollis gellanilyticus TaxID=748831 RepID=A0A512MGD5_9BACT|nr:DUF4282 domain-containing protein [Brevifollis gellanilyticus]GEP45411.1 hypothetical protein BGE01nite_47020 [Brevifollis gellanilyticus]